MNASLQDGARSASDPAPVPSASSSSVDFGYPKMSSLDEQMAPFHPATGNVGSPVPIVPKIATATAGGRARGLATRCPAPGRNGSWTRSGDYRAGALTAGAVIVVL